MPQLLLTGDATSLISALEKANFALSKFKNVQQNTIKDTIAYDEEMNKLKRSLVFTTEEGRKLAITFSNIDEEFKVTNLSIEKSSKFLDNLKKSSRNARSETAKLTSELRAVRNQAKRTEESKSTARFFSSKVKREATGLNTLDIKTQFGLKSALSDLETLIVKTQVTRGQINKIWSELSRGQVNQYRGKLLSIQKALININDKVIRIRKEHERLQRSTNKWQKLIDKAKKNSKELTLSWRSIFRVIEVQLIRRAMANFLRKIREGVSEAIKLEISIGEISTISQNMPLTFDRWANSLLKVSTSFGISVLDEAEGAYQTLSNQIAEGSESLQFLVSANRLAITSVSKVSQSVNALTAVMNAYNLSAFDSEEVSSKLFKTVELGRVRLKEMANSIGDVAVPASTLGISLSELLSLISTLTVRGIKFSQAQTQIRGILLKLIKPTSELQTLFEEWGFSSGQAAVQGLGFREVLRRISKETGNSALELSKFINRIRGLVGILSLTGKGAEDFKRNTEEIKNATRSYSDAYILMTKNMGFQFKKQVNEMSNLFRQFAIHDVLPLIAKLTGGIDKLSASVVSLVASLGVLATGTSIILLVKNFDKLAAAIAFIFANPVTSTLISVLIGVSILVGKIVKKNILLEKERKKAFDKGWEDNVETVKKAIKKINKAKKESVELSRKSDLFALSEQRKVLVKELEERKNLFKDELETQKKFNDSQIKNLKSSIKQVNRTITNNLRLIKQGKDLVDKLTNIKNKTVLEFKLDKLDNSSDKVLALKKKIILVSKEIKRLKKISNIFENNNDISKVDNIQNRIRELFKQMVEFEKKLDKLTSRRKIIRPVSTDKKNTDEEFSKLNLSKNSDIIERFTSLIEQQKAQITRIVESSQSQVVKSKNNLSDLQDTFSDLQSKLEFFQNKNIFKAIIKGNKDSIEATDKLILKVKELDEALGVQDLGATKLSNLAIGIKDTVKAIDANSEIQNSIVQDSKSKLNLISESGRITSTLLSFQKDSIESLTGLDDKLSKHLQDSGSLSDSVFSQVLSLAGVTDNIRVSILNNTLTIDQLTNANKKFTSFTKDVDLQAEHLSDIGDSVSKVRSNLLELTDFYKKNIRYIKEYSAALKEQKEILNNKQSKSQPQIHYKRFEFFPGFSKGGFVAGSGDSDTVKSLLTPGEFVVNKKAASKFKTQLININSNNPPSNVSTNNTTNVGDINVSLQSTGNEQLDIIKFAKLYKRAVNSGVLSV